MATLDDVPEHIERILIRPLVETFCYNYIYKNKCESFIVKTVEYISKESCGKADVYFLQESGEYSHFTLKIPITKRQHGERIKLHLQDPVISHQDNKKPYSL